MFYLFSCSVLPQKIIFHFLHFHIFMFQNRHHLRSSNFRSKAAWLCSQCVLVRSAVARFLKTVKSRYCQWGLALLSFEGKHSGSCSGFTLVPYRNMCHNFSLHFFPDTGRLIPLCVASKECFSPVGGSSGTWFVLTLAPSKQSNVCDDAFKANRKNDDYHNRSTFYTKINTLIKNNIIIYSHYLFVQL